MRIRHGILEQPYELQLGVMTRHNARRAEVTAALGPAPTTVNDITYHYSVDPVAAYEFMQYDRCRVREGLSLSKN